jgi:hypothetical protein
VEPPTPAELAAQRFRVDGVRIAAIVMAFGLFTYAF